MYKMTNSIDLANSLTTNSNPLRLSNYMNDELLRFLIKYCLLPSRGADTKEEQEFVDLAGHRYNDIFIPIHNDLLCCLVHNTIITDKVIDEFVDIIP